MNATHEARRIAVIAVIVAIPVGAWGIHYGGDWERTAAIATVSAAASAHGCKLNGDDVNRLITQYRDQNDIGWSESGDAVAKTIGKNCAAATSS